jgi:glycine cleavage system H protein
MYPEDLRYTPEHEWARRDGDRVRVGITHFAQDSLGDIVYVDIPAPGTAVTADQPFGEVESTKSVSDLFSPVSGTIVERNADLEDAPELVNQDPYGKGWMVAIEPSDPADVEKLMNASEYQALVEAQP